VRFALGASSGRGDEPLKRRYARPQQLALEQLVCRRAQQRKRGVVLQRVLDQEILNASKVGVVDVTESRDHGGVVELPGVGVEGRPEVPAGECGLGPWQQLLGGLAGDLRQQTLERVTQVPLAEIDLSLRPALLDDLQHSGVRVAHDPRWRTGQSREELPPRSRGRVGERLQAPQLALPIDVGQGAQDVPREVAALGGVAAAQAKVEVIEYQRSVIRPRRRRVRREHDGREHLDPVGGELSVPRVATAGEPSSRALGRLAVGLALPEPDERPRDLPRDLPRRKAIAARCLQTLMRRDRALAFHAVLVTGDLTRQRLGERVRRPVHREATKPLTLTAWRAVPAEELHPRARMTTALRPSARAHQIPPDSPRDTPRS